LNKERSLPTDAEGNRLLGSLLMIELDIGQDGPGLRGKLALVGADGQPATSSAKPLELTELRKRIQAAVTK